MGIEKAILSGLGAIAHATPLTGTAPLSASGVLNGAALGTTATLVYDNPNNGKNARVKIVCVTAGRNLAWELVAAGAAASVCKADGDGSADEGSLIMGGGGASEEFTVGPGLDLYLVASLAGTAYQVTVVESP